MTEDVEEVSEDALVTSHDTLARNDDKSIEQSNGVDVINQNNIDDNVMMKNLLSLTKQKSQTQNNNSSDRPSEEVKVAGEVLEEGEDEEDFDVVVESEEGRCRPGVLLDFSRIPQEELDVRKFNYDVILGFVSKGKLHSLQTFYILYITPLHPKPLRTLPTLILLHPYTIICSLGPSPQGATDGESSDLLQFLEEFCTW